MGTRADFYEKKQEAELEWLGSIAFDGYIDGIAPSLLGATSAEKFHGELDQFFGGRDDVTFPKEGWPWPWDTSDTSDCAYCFNGERVVYYLGNAEWGEPINWDEDEKKMPHPCTWIHAVPNMKERKNVTRGKRSGLIVISKDWQVKP